MRPLTNRFAAGLVALLTVSCAASGPAPISVLADADSLSTVTDSLELAAYDDIYVAKHADLIKELTKREEGGETAGRLIEARSLVAASEELYLRGMFAAAIKLLDEASRTLIQDR
jgi:hypothetical protein